MDAGRRTAGGFAIIMEKNSGIRLKKLKTLLCLHLLLVVYSLSGILGKLAAKENFLSVRFCFLYAGIIVLLGVYAIVWQQIIKRIPLTTAFANKAVIVVWGIIWGALFFHEPVTIGKVIGALLVICGIVLYAVADREGSNG